MGESYSKEKEDIMISGMFSIAETYGVIPDITIDGSLLMYSGLNSTSVLEQHSSQMVSDLVSKVPNYMTNLGSSLSAFELVPNAVGLGALIISFLLDLTVSSLIKVPEDSPLNMMQRVFAEEKASGVRDSMDEYLKRLHKYVWEPEQALEETRRLEKQLSEQLTRLRNSMLKDGQMSSRAMKIWVNGAAFHAQMLIHEARLMMAGYGSKEEKNLDVRVASVHNMVNHYQKDLEDLLKEYKSYKRTNMHLQIEVSKCGFRYAFSCQHHMCYIYDEELGKSTRKNPRTLFHDYYEKSICHGSLDAYINYMFSNWGQIKKLSEYFTVLNTNIRELITQNRNFTMKNV
ncbi:uncharacterized protein LOC125740089 isoform X2 [Brienomyrus brachyistius]|uniref:uncharacterized protein LOC125740089 isoform X2 n=1 Tax=Brienomyrus brachyistius TaxID=42636 RepID=UPI0020B42394|nr:uncharacterized protein LOC125740089 isoform X2 [Brienomyrus brachyistius]XP_048866785.1 uncharacterized protein LOC125740089 isoform X2 [Brienomyrus brachyistius]